jgi:hypothetical protein
MKPAPMMSEKPEHSPPQSSAPLRSPDPADSGSGGRTELEPSAHLARIEQLLREIHVLLDAREREQQHREFPLLGWLATISQGIALLFLISALMDWFADADVGRVLNRVALAALFQLITLTALLAGLRRPG